MFDWFVKRRARLDAEHFAKWMYCVQQSPPNIEVFRVYEIRQLARTGCKAYGEWFSGANSALWFQGIHAKKWHWYFAWVGSPRAGDHHQEWVRDVTRVFFELSNEVYEGMCKHRDRTQPAAANG